MLESHPLWLVVAGADGDAKPIPRRDLAPVTFEDIYTLHEIQGDRVSKETLRKYWKSHWKMVMPIRDKGLHGRCPKCAEHSQE